MTSLDLLERPATRTLIEAATELAECCAGQAAEHDSAGSFVAPNLVLAAELGLLEAGVPAELGGGGADIRALGDMLRRVAHGCSSTALALSMHTHQVAFPAWRWHHLPATRDKTEPLLRRVADERLALLSSGGGDWIGGSGTAEPVENGYRITARKPFVSGAQAGRLLGTSAISPEDGGTIIHFACPMNAPEVSIVETWDTLGMRGTGSHDVLIEGLFVPADKVALRRPQGQWHPFFFMLATIAFPLIYAVYLGLAERARDIAVGVAARQASSARSRDRAGRMDTALLAARLAYEHMIATTELNAPSAETVSAVMSGRRLVEENAIRTVELAMELAGGPGFYRKTELERLFRDVQAARYHPLQKETQAEFAGALALGDPIDAIY